MVPNKRSQVVGKRFPLKFSLAAPSLLVFEQEDYTMTTAIATISKTFTPEGSAPVAFVFREDGWFHMTKAANSFGKRLQDFWDNKDAKQYMQALSETIHANQRELFEARAGYNGGTWAHPKLAVFFARWLDVKFAVWCDAMIDDILKGNAEVTITKPGVSSLNSLGVAGFWSGFDGRSFCLLERVDLEAREHRVGHMVPT
jgi:hypothetical protein